jgi:hypothetical protein
MKYKDHILMFIINFASLLVWAQNEDVKKNIDRCSVSVNTPRKAVDGFLTMDNSPVMGNGNLMITVGSTQNSLTFYLGKTDFWRDKCHEKENDGWQSALVLPSSLHIKMPGFSNAAFRQTLDMYNAEIVTVFSEAGSEIKFRTVTPHEADNFLINEISNTGKNTVGFLLETTTLQYRIPNNPFEILAGKHIAKENIAWVTRKTHVPPVYEEYGSKNFRMWAATGTKVLGTKSTLSVENKWSFSTDDNDVKTTSQITILPGEKIYVVTKVNSAGIPVTMNPENPLPALLDDLKNMDNTGAVNLISSHRKWWGSYWNKSYIDLNDERLVERVYYGALYVFGCANKVGKYPAGCNGWPVNDMVVWGGDYHWNYNNQAVYYGAFSSNRTELSEPYDRTVTEANIFGRRHAEKLGVPGTVFFVATAPGHLNEAQTIDQRTHAVEAALNQINHWYYTYDIDWMKANYRFLIDVADYWDFDLLKNAEVRSDGTLRYVVINSAPMEGASNDKFNGITGMAFLKRFYTAMIEITTELNKAGFPTGKNERDIAQWNDFVLRMSDYPKSYAYGRKVFAWSEQSLNPLLTQQDWILYPVFPTEQVGLSSNPELLKIARNTLVIKPQYYMEWLNNPTQIFSIASRLAHHPPEILERFKAYFDGLGINNFKSSGSNTENTAILESINSMLMQSQEGFIRLFPCWHFPDASFYQLRSTGAFLVSAEKRNGVIQPFSVFSEKGRECSVLSPWGESDLIVTDETGNIIGTTPANYSAGKIFSFQTKTGTTYKISSKEKLPAEIPYPNAALYKKVTTSSDYQPDEKSLLHDNQKYAELARLDNASQTLSIQKPNWGTAKLTDGARINTSAGHRGWTSNLHDNENNTEWLTVDLGKVDSVKSIHLWPLDHGDAWQHTHCTEPFVNSGEIDQSFDGFPLSFKIMVSVNETDWTEVARFENYALPASNIHLTEQKPKDILGPEIFQFRPQEARYVKVEASKLRKTRYFGKYAMQLAEIEVIRRAD